MKNQDIRNHLKIKRVYDPILPDDGYRILVDRLWPRGMKKEFLKIDLWAKYIAPSNELRKTFGHEAEHFDAFKEGYAQELKHNPQTKDFISILKKQSENQNVTLLFSAKSEVQNQAAVLRDYAAEQLTENNT